MAEVYWDREWTMQQQGFDYAYDKRLYDRLREGHARPVREHFHAGLDYQNKLARFMENHDEPRAAATFSPDVHEAAAVDHVLVPRSAFLSPGTIPGAQDTHLSPSGARSAGTDRPEAGTVLRPAAWPCCVSRPCATASGNCSTAHLPGTATGPHDAFLVFAWQGAGGERLLVTVNYAPNQSQCYVRLPFADLGNGRWRLHDMIGDATYDREGSDLQERGLYLDEAPWQCRVFTMAETQ